MAAKLDFDKINMWLEEAGFDDGLKDKALKKPIIIAALVIFGSLFWIRSSSGKIHVANTKLAAEKKRSKVIAKYKEAASSISSISSSVTLPRSTDAGSWLQEKLREYSRNSGLKIKAFDPVKTAYEFDDFNAKEAKITFSGTYNQLGEFVNLVETTKPFIGMLNLDIARDQFKAKQGLLLKINANFLAFQNLGKEAPKKKGKKKK
ncbi:type 4a pilus biogenesis protein PilO [Elusimicrobiota bacterium]